MPIKSKTTDGHELEKSIATVNGDAKSALTTNKYRSPINVNSKLDDLGLDPYEFRIYSHVARRAGKTGECFSRVEDMASVCKMSPRKVRYTLSILCSAGLLLAHQRPGRKTITYRLAQMEEWPENLDLEEIRSQAKSSKA